jgi:threonine dehydratase
MQIDLPTIEDIHAARRRIAGQVRITPVLQNAALDQLSAARLWFKCENLQHIGAFKFRGASNAVLSLTDEQARPGVLTHSSGNHGAALGLAARLRGIPAHIVVPDNAPAIKLANMRETGAILHLCAANLASRETTAAGVQAETGASMIHPFTDPRVIAGQGTAALELLEAEPDLDTLVVPVGGGGLLSGTAIAAHAHSASIRVYAAEPEGAADAYRAMQTGKREQNPAADTICDGLRTGIGETNFAIMQRERVRVLTASDDEIVAAMRLLWDRLKLIIEPSAAVCLAVILRHPSEFSARRVGIVLSGGNVDLQRLPWRADPP